MGKIKLMDGSELDGRLRPDAVELSWASKAERDAEAELFIQNAHSLLEQAPRIFGDSRLFLAPVRIMSGLAYTGALPLPCLGGYLEWWLNADGAANAVENDRELVYVVSGSMLSGTNCSMVVRRDGTRCQAVGLLRPLAKSFCEVMRRYQEPMRKMEAYSLAEALSHLGLVAN